VIDIHPKDLTLAQLRAQMLRWDEKPFRGEQVFRGLYRHGARTPDEIRGIPAELRKKLPAELFMLRLNDRIASRQDETQKFLFEAADGVLLETVYMEYSYGSTVCISSQAGCRMGCAFCASGLPGLMRNLTPGEMADQVLLARELSGADIRHVVVMGTGEPFDNPESLAAFIEIITDPLGLGLSRRGITVSTCGLLGQLARFAKAFPQVGVAISLHAPNDLIRQKIMPVARRYPMDKVLAAARAYTEETGRRITFEYALIGGVNDAREHAEELAEKLRGMNAHVNLIRLHTVPESGLAASDSAHVEGFLQTLLSRHIQATLRRSLGEDIFAACGQLRNSRTKPR
jgi:23S rRNA (adenine2503-C2)-methyltransferase